MLEHVGKLLESCLDHLMECFQMFSASPLVLNKLLPDAVDTNLLSFSAKTCLDQRKSDTPNIAKLSGKHHFKIVTEICSQSPFSSSFICHYSMIGSHGGSPWVPDLCPLGCQRFSVHRAGARYWLRPWEQNGRTTMHQELGKWEDAQWRILLIFYVVLHRFHNQGIWTNTWTCMSL